MGQTSCILLGLECHVWHVCNGINVMEYFKSGIIKNKIIICYSYNQI